MSRRWRGAHGALAIGIAVLAAACGDAPPTAPDPDPPPPPPPSTAPVASVAVTPGMASVEIAAQVQLTAATMDSAGQLLTGRAVAWSSADPAISTVDSTGLVTGVARGSMYVRASSEGQADSALVSILIPAETFVGAGDIADCTTPDDERTADLLDQIPGTVFTLGDNAYEDGTATEFTNCYEPTWGRHKARTYPSIGNHDYKTLNGQPYFDYYGANAGDPAEGWYSFVLGAWKIIVLNSNDTKVGVGPGSAQVTWLRAELENDPHECTLAYWHHPRFSSGFHGDDPALGTLWETLVEFGAELALAGHDHSYERFAAMDGNGVADPVAGMRHIVVGTGGRFLRPHVIAGSTSEVRNSDTFGVMKLTLRDGSYDWEFVPVAGQTFTDSGSEVCH